MLPGNPWGSDDSTKTESKPDAGAIRKELLDSDVIPRAQPPERPRNFDKAPENSIIRVGPNGVDVVIPNLPDFWVVDPSKEKQNSAGQTRQLPADKSLPNTNNGGAQPTQPKEQTIKPGEQTSQRQGTAPNVTPYNPFNDPSFKPLKPGEAWFNKPPQKLPDIFKPTDQSGGPGPRISPERVVEFRNMRFRSADHGDLPDALIRLPKNFDPSKPINLVVYNHGYRDSIQSALVNAELGRQMDLAPPNTVLFLPEWQEFPAASNAKDGDFGDRNLFKNMVQEVFDKTPELKGRTWNDVKNFDVISHSGGDKAVVSIVNANGLGDKITSITLLDSTYVIGNQLDWWLKLNVHDLASGRKQFRSIYKDTASQSRDQADRLRQFLTQARLPADRVYQDDRRGTGAMSADEIARNPIIYKYSDATYNGKGPHTSLPMLYIGPIQAANRDTRR